MTSSVWLVISIGALFARLFVFNLPEIILDIAKLVFASLVLLGVMSLWALLTTHIEDMSLEAEREINKQIKDKDKQNSDN